ncbi:MAG: hypothetical protein SF172_18110 [Burkholderiales bacterium]|nr:hypothetical protein [Burkholderiales bacterium]
MTAASTAPPGPQPATDPVKTGFSAQELDDMKRLGIHHIAGNFLYRQYRYERLADAVNYAELERGKIDYQAEVNVQPAWLSPVAPNNGDWRVMKELGITFDGKRYHFLNYRYERFQDAINQADHLRREHWGEERPPNNYF